MSNELAANMTFEVALKHLNAFANLISENYDLRQLVVRLERELEECKEVLSNLGNEEEASSLPYEG